MWSTENVAPPPESAARHRAEGEEDSRWHHLGRQSEGKLPGQGEGAAWALWQVCCGRDWVWKPGNYLDEPDESLARVHYTEGINLRPWQVGQ